MGLFNFFSSEKASGVNEDFILIKKDMELLAFPQALYRHELSDEAQRLYIEYCKFLNSILCATAIKAAYTNVRSISGEDDFTKQLFRCVMEDGCAFQRKYILTGRIKKDDAFGVTTFKRFSTNRDVLEFVMIHEGTYDKDFKALLETGEAFEVDDTTGRKYYHSFLRGMFCVKVTEEPWGISLKDDEIHLVDWDRTGEFLETLLTEYKGLVFKYKQKR